jgi:retron-type reverse transcriptase
MSNHTLVTRNTVAEGAQLIERLVERKNMMSAYSRVTRNKGAAGVDRMTVGQLKPYLRLNW